MILNVNKAEDNVGLDEITEMEKVYNPKAVEEMVFVHPTAAHPVYEIVVPATALPSVSRMPDTVKI